METLAKAVGTPTYGYASQGRRDSWDALVNDVGTPAWGRTPWGRTAGRA
jgi:hypothetical protein